MRRCPLGASAASSGLNLPLRSKSSSAPVAFHPLFKNLQMLRIFAHMLDRHLVRAPSAFDGLTIHHFRSRPAFRSAENQHRPARAFGLALFAEAPLYRPNLGQNRIEDSRHPLVHHRGVIAFEEIRRVAVAAK